MFSVGAWLLGVSLQCATTTAFVRGLRPFFVFACFWDLAVPTQKSRGCFQRLCVERVGSSRLHMQLRGGIHVVVRPMDFLFRQALMMMYALRPYGKYQVQIQFDTSYVFPDQVNAACSTYASVWNNARLLWRQRDGELPGVLPAGVRQDATQVPGTDRWRNFVRHMTAGGTGQSTADLGIVWRSMSEEDKNKHKVSARTYRVKATPVIANCLPKRHLPPEASPHKLSDGVWPLAQDEAAKVVMDISKFHQEWETLVGGILHFKGLDDDNLLDDRVSPCCVMLGLGKCKQACNQQLLIEKRAADALLRRLVYFVPDGLELDGVRDLPLYYIAPNGTDEHCNTGILGLMVASLKNPVLAVFMEPDRSGQARLDPGTVLRLPLEKGSSSMWEPSNLVWKLAELGSGPNVYHVRYQWRPAARMEILGVDKVTDLLWRSRERPQSEKDPVFDSLVSLQKPIKQQTSKRPRRNTKAADADHGADDTQAAAVDDSSDDSDFIMSAMPPPPPPPPLPLADVSDNVADIAGDAPAEDALADWQYEADQEHLPAVERVTAAKAFVRHPETNDIMGSISLVRPGSRTEAQSVYCRLHQFKTPMRRAARANTEVDIQRWFARGMVIPAGAAGARIHLQAWRHMGL